MQYARPGLWAGGGARLPCSGILAGMNATGGRSGSRDEPQPANGADGMPPVSGVVQAACPYLVAAGGGWRGTDPTKDHRCTAIEPPVALALAKQRDLCLRTAHTSCATFQAASELDAAAGSRAPAGDAGLWPTMSGPLVALTPVRGRAPQLPGARSRGAQAALVGLMVLAFVVLVVARTSPPGSGTGASAAPGGQVAPSGSIASGPATPLATASPSAPSTAPPATPGPSVPASPVATPVASVSPSTPPTTYTVRRGDTLSSIAAANGTTVKKLKKVNGLTSTLIRVGQELILP